MHGVHCHCQILHRERQQKQTFATLGEPLCGQRVRTRRLHQDDPGGATEKAPRHDAAGRQLLAWTDFDSKQLGVTRSGRIDVANE